MFGINCATPIQGGRVRSVHTPEYKFFLSLLREARARQGLTQRELARRLQCHQSFVAKYELGERRLDFVEAIRVADALGVDPLEIVGRVREQLRPKTARGKKLPEEKN